MARKTVIILEDDLDGSEADETVDFAVDGAEYEIDLTAGHADELRRVLGRYIKAARKTSGGGVRVRQLRMPRVGVDAKAIRLWAIDNGLQVNTRGRIQADIVEKYQAAH
jgi:hypothetical protein